MTCQDERVVYRFNDVVIDGDNREVRVDGTLKPTEPQVLAVLTHLIEHRDRVVPKDELLDEVWGTRHVSAAAVTSRIKSARAAIGDSGRDQLMIRTIHGRGYRFVAELDAHGAPGPATDPLEPPLPATSRATTASTRTLDDGWPLVGRDAERDTAASAAARGEGGGLLITGPAGLGKTRLARAVIETVAAHGRPVARINGQLGSANVPLAALAHLLPLNVTADAGLQGELARTVLLQRARSALHELAGDERLTLMVDDVDRVDNLSRALLGSLISDGTVFAVMTQRIEHDELLSMEHLIRSGEMSHLRLGTLPADQMIALLGRVFDGPVQPMTSQALVHAADGYPGVLRQLVEASIASGALTMRSGVWRLNGRVTPPGNMAAAVRQRLADLDDDQRDAVELLAIAGDLDLDTAFSLIDDEVLDRLELEGMISVREVGPSTRIRLAHPLYGEVLADSITPLRDRRHRAALAEALSGSDVANTSDRLRLVRLRLDGDQPIDDELLIESAALALIESDTSLTLRLLRRVDPSHHTVRYQQLMGEVLYNRGRFDEAADVWFAMDLDDMADDMAAGVIRRLATWMFYGKWRFDEAIDFLDQRLQRFDGENRMALESYWTMIAAIEGRRAATVIDRAERLLPSASDHSAVDFLSGSAMANFVLGRYDRTLELLRICNERAEGLAPTIHWTNLGYANFVEILTHVETGNIDAGWATFERITEPGAPPAFGFVSIAAGRLALAAGRWQQTLDWLDPQIQITEALGITTNGRPLQASAALAALMLGQHDRAAEVATTMRSDLPDAVNITALDIHWSILGIEAVTGDRDAAMRAMLEQARRAGEAGLFYMESLMLSAAVHHGGADDAVDRLAELAEIIDGELIGLRHRSALVALGRDDADGVLAELDRRGLVFEATSLRQAIAR